MSTTITRIIVLALIATLATFSGCGGGGTTSESGTQPPVESGSPPPVESGTPLPARTLSWEAPNSYSDNTTLNPFTDLDRFEIYVNTSGTFTDTDSPLAAVSAVDPATKQLSTSFNLANLSPHLTVGPQYYVSLRSVGLTGLKSSFSTPGSFSFSTS